VVTVDELLAGFTSFTVGATLDVFVMVVPDAVPAFTFTTIGNCTDVPAGKATPTVQTPPVPGQQLMAPVPPTAGSVGQVTPAGTASDTNVVLAGTLVENVGFDGLAGPGFEMLYVNVMLFPAVTVLGAAELVSMRSNCPAVATVTTTLELLLPGFESVVVDEVLAVFVIFVPETVAPGTVTIRVNVVVPPDGNEVSVQCTLVVGAGQVHAVPDCARLEKVVPVGMGSLNCTFAAAAGPLFPTTIVYVIVLPARTGLGDAVLRTTMFAVVARPTTVRTLAVLFARFGSVMPEVMLAVSTI